MPEGDTIFRTAASLRRVLQDAEITDVATTVPQVRAIGPRRLVGQRVAEVESRGKHLLCWFAPSDLALHTHMMMSGSWHLYRPGQRWRKPRRLARVVLSVEGWDAVCFSAPVVELLSRAQVDEHHRLGGLGPDALGDTVDVAEARRRLDAREDASIGDALLDQRVLAGVGNVFRCEVLFLHGIAPTTRVGDLDPATRDAVLATAVRLLRDNAGGGRARRVTTEPTGTGPRSGQPGRGPAGARPAGAGPAHHVYGRAGRPCTRCGHLVRSGRQGEQARVVYWCPHCQA